MQQSRILLCCREPVLRCFYHGGSEFSRVYHLSTPQTCTVNYLSGLTASCQAAWLLAAIQRKPRARLKQRRRLAALHVFWTHRMNYSFQDRWCVSNFSVKMNQRPLTPPPRSSEPPLKLSANTISTLRRQAASKLVTPVIFWAWPCIRAEIRLGDERFDSALCHSSESCVAHIGEPQSEENIACVWKMNRSRFVYFFPHSKIFS